jgi:triphosphoribosyl-dephospho-CoA synthetase
MIPDVDIWRAALLMVKRYGEDAMREARARARELMADGDMDGCTTWMRIGDAIERLQAKAPAEDEKVH